MKMTSKAIVFFGNEKLATGLPEAKPIIRHALEAAGFEIEQVITGKLSDLKPHQSKIAILAAYGRIIPQKVLDEFPMGIINVHPSLLPQYRGPTPIEQAILDGITETGVSIMRLTAGMDEGPLYKQKKVRLLGTESKSELVTTLQKLGADLLVSILPLIAKGSLQPRQQPQPDQASYTSKISKSDGTIDWKKSAEQVEREIRAFLGWPGSRTSLFGKDVIITKARAIPAQGIPGTVEAAKNSGTLTVYCNPGRLEIEMLKPASKREMATKEFLAGLRT